MISVNISEATAKLAALVETVANSDEVIFICRDGRPEARLSRARANDAADPLVTHPELQGRILYDPTETATKDDWQED